MLIALLAILGVDLAVLVVLLLGVLARRRWVNQRPGAFAGAIRVASGKHHGVGPKWRRGYGRWVRDVFVWTKKPFLFRNELVPVDRFQDVRPAREGEVKRLGAEPVVIELAADGAVIQLAAPGKHRDRALGPYPDRAARGKAASGLDPDASWRLQQARAKEGPPTAPAGFNKQKDSR